MTRAPADVSVIIPTRNRAGRVAEAVDSILGQSPASREVIVVDDGSTDETASVIRAFGAPVRYLCQRHAGPAAARNRGIREARAEILAFLDDDDLWSPDKLARQLPELLGHADTEIVLGYTQRMVLREVSRGSEQFVAYKEPVRLFSLGCGLFRRAVFDRVGLLDQRMQHAEDDDWFMRARSLRVRMRFIPEVTLYYRFHGSNMSTDREGKLPDLLRLIKNRLDRTRNGQEGV
jgi:glycosyltransferase involved in cell wall biosynthesis